MRTARAAARLVVGAALIAASVAASAIELTVFYTNDVHARLERFDALSELMSSEREAGRRVLWFDAGDAWQDHRRMLSSVWGYRETLDWMNEGAVSAMALGNHDSYWGPHWMAKLIGDAAFPVLTANWVPVGGESLGLQPATVIQVGGLSILVVGLTTAEFLPVPAFPTQRYLDPILALNAQLEMYKGRFDLLFVVGHISIRNARRIARSVPQVDLFVSGHSHERTDTPIRESETVVVQSGAFAQVLGRLRLDVKADDGAVEILSNDLIAIETTPADMRAGAIRFTSVAAAVAAALMVWWF